jgi:ornithine cyclodeaminase
MRVAFTADANSQTVAPQEFVLTHPDQGEVHIKGAYLIGSPWVITKFASAGFQIAGNHGFTVVMSAQSGAIEALIDDNGWLTEMRTAAAGALSVELLARPDARCVAIIGSGVQAEFQLAALRAIRHVDQVRVAGRTAANVESFARRHNAVACASIDEAVDDADIVICATTSRVPVLAHVRPGTHVTAIGADTAGKQELHPTLVRCADAVFVDDVELARRSGILQDLPDVNASTVGDVLTGRSAGRTGAEQITLAGLSGLGVQDAAIGELVMKQLAIMGP